MKRDCLIVLVSICVFATGAPKALCKGVLGSDGYFQGQATPAPNAGSQDQEKPPQSEKPASTKPAAKLDRKSEQIKGKLQTLGIASRVTVQLNNGNERYGSIERLDEDSFQMAEVDMKQLFTVAYRDVKNVRQGYGNPNQFTGRRWNPIWAKISLIAVGAMFVLVFVAVPRD